MSRPLKIAFWATITGQIILLLAFVSVKEDILRTGTTVVLQTVPVDPRSLFQGDFVRLDYEIAQLPARWDDAAIGQPVYVELREGVDGVWRADAYRRKKPGAGRVFLKGTTTSGGRLDFGIGTYFVPEDTGLEIERAQDVKVRAAVSKGGSAVIKGLLVDGVLFDP